METYTTQQGDTWDMIAYRLTGNTNQTSTLIQANQEYMDVFIFGAGMLLNVPDGLTEETDTSMYPPWKTEES